MTATEINGTQGYASEADALVKQYESISFTDVHRRALHLIPSPPCRAVDIGAGTGRDAAALAALGHHVVAVEPTAALRERAMALHPSPAIEWLDDSLPELTVLTVREATFDLVMLTAVWMHLDERERAIAMPCVARLVRPGGVLIMTLRYGPVPNGRRMFAVSTDETIQLAMAAGLGLVSRDDSVVGVLRRPGVSWARLAFARAAL